MHPRQVPQAPYRIPLRKPANPFPTLRAAERQKAVRQADPGSAPAGKHPSRAPLYVRGAVTGFSAAFFNTLFFMGLLILLFGSTPEMQSRMAGRSAFAYIIASTGVNALVEMLVATLVTGAAAAALKKARLI